MNETEKAVCSLKNNKATGLVEMSAESLKHDRDVASIELQYLFNLMWQKGEVQDISGDPMGVPES